MNIETNTIQVVEDMDERLAKRDGRKKRNMEEVGRVATLVGFAQMKMLAKYVYPQQMNEYLSTIKNRENKENQSIASLLSPQRCCFFLRCPLSRP
jgi:adenylate kinase